MLIKCNKLNTSDITVYSNISVSDADNSSDGLEIDISESPTPQTEINIEDKRVLENLEEEIERLLDEKAAKSNLSATNVKNILRQVITNEHVLAMVRHTAEGNQVDTEQFEYEPKLTRAKAKELLKTQTVAAIPWAKTKPKSEVHILINEELPEDSDDDEYVPESEDDKESGRASDLESQPATPATPASTHDNSTQTNWTDDGIFKIPLPAQNLSNENNENIALRTRSKLSLSDTPLEKIEEAFIPPDITTDMYDLECDDEDWSDFLKKFTRPLDEAVHGTLEDDDETDPEYNVLADMDVDVIDQEERREELRQDRAVKVTKKELNNLVAELFEFSEMFSTGKDDKIQENRKLETSQTEDVISIKHNSEQQQSSDIDQIIQSIPESIFSSDQQLLFEQQMRQHVQMVTQNFILTYEHPILGEMASNFKDMLLSYQELSKYKTSSAFKAYNLDMAIEFIAEWEKIYASNSPEVLNAKKHIENDIKLSNGKNNNVRRSYIVTFPSLILKTVSESSVFLYPDLLPKIPFRCNFVNPRSLYLPSEDSLIALGLEQFIPYMESKRHYKTKFGKTRLSDAAFFITKYMMPHKESRKIYNRIRCMNEVKAPPNPIKFYFVNNKAPIAIHYVVPLHIHGVMPPCLRPPDTLPYQWKTFLYPEPKNSPAPLAKVQKPPAFNKKPPVKKRNRVKKKNKSENESEAQLIVINNGNIIDSKIEVRSPPLLTLDEKVAKLRLETDQILTASGKKRKLLPKIETASTVFRYSTPKRISPRKKQNKTQLNIHRTTPRTRSASQKFNGIPAYLRNFKFNSSIFKNIKNSNMLPSMPFLLTSAKEPCTSTSCSPEPEPIEQKKDNLESEKEKEEPVPDKLENRVSPERLELERSQEVDSTTNDSEIQKESKKDDEDELNALMVASTTLQQKRRLQACSSKKAKQIREYNANLAMLCPEDPNTTEEKAKNYAQAFYDKVQERLENDSPLEYQKFMEVLSEHDESVNTVSELYEKIEAVLSPKHPDLCEEFLTFLTPEQAQQIGKLVPHFMLSNMSLFLRKLEIYYKNQPAQLRRIYNSLTELAEIPDITMDQVRSSILPLLKGNTLLIDWFLQMFPQESPPESLMSNWEQVSCDDDDGIDSDKKLFETITIPEVEDPYGGPNCICSCHKIADEMYASRARHCIPCGTKFLQGRVYVQTGKGLRLANVTFNNSPNTDHNKRLSVEPITRPKRKSETSPSKIMMSPTKQDDEPRHSNESEDDVNTDTNCKKIKSLKPFRTSSPPKSRKRPIKPPRTPKSECKKDTKPKNKTELASPSTKKSIKVIKPLKKPDECTSDDLMEEFSIPDGKTETVENEPKEKTKEECTEIKDECIETKEESTETKEDCMETNESENEVGDWDVKVSPGHSVESMDTCEESSQDTTDAQNTDSDNDSIVEIESVISDNSEDSGSQCDETIAESHSWTRDEDKVILQTFQEHGESQNVFKIMQQLLPERRVSQIKQRFHTLMSLLQEMASGSTD